MNNELAPLNSCASHIHPVPSYTSLASESTLTTANGSNLSSTTPRAATTATTAIASTAAATTQWGEERERG